MGSLSGAFLASLVIGVLQTFAVAIDYSLLQLFKDVGVVLSADWQNNSFIKLTVSQVAPILPYLMLVLILIVWMVFATILPIMTSDPTVEPTPHQTVFADLAPSLLADERIYNDG
jgi:ascorbate-specific PTS system EIIC-type component UlaA